MQMTADAWRNLSFFGEDCVNLFSIFVQSAFFFCYNRHWAEVGSLVWPRANQICKSPTLHFTCARAHRAATEKARTVWSISTFMSITLQKSNPACLYIINYLLLFCRKQPFPTWTDDVTHHFCYTAISFFLFVFLSPLLQSLTILPAAACGYRDQPIIQQLVPPSTDCHWAKT